MKSIVKDWSMKGSNEEKLEIDWVNWRQYSIQFISAAVNTALVLGLSHRISLLKPGMTGQKQEHFFLYMEKKIG